MKYYTKEAKEIFNQLEGYKLSDILEDTEDNEMMLIFEKYNRLQSLKILNNGYEIGNIKKSEVK